jgi:hypothetical protein
MDLMPKNEEAFLPPRKRATGRKHNPNRGCKSPNPHSEYHTVKPLPQETLELKIRLCVNLYFSRGKNLTFRYASAKWHPARLP